MLLKHLYDFAKSRNLLADLAFSSKAIRWIIELDASGNLLGVVETGDGKRGHEFSCPQTTRPKVSGGVSEFLADGLTAIFGFESDMEKIGDLSKKAAGTGPEAKKARRTLEDREQNNAAKQKDFWRQIAEAASATNHPGLLLLRTFGEVTTQAGKADFLHHGTPHNPARNDTKPAWYLRVSSGEEKKLGPENFTFRANGELLLENEAIRQWWRECHASEIKQNNEALSKGLCLVTGLENQSVALTHNPKIKGIPKTQSFGAAIVSFDKPAFESYGFDQSRNAPTSDEAATAYCTALNHLLESDETSLRLGKTTPILCFWAVQTKTAGSLFSRLLNKPDPLTVRNFLVSPWAGIERGLARKDQFIAVTLVGNSGRVVVRHWLQETLEQAIENFQKWFGDLEIAVPQKPQPKTPKNQKKADGKIEHNPLSVYWLANTTVRDSKDLRPEIPAQLYRAALENSAPSISLIKPILEQLQSRLLRDENYKIVYDQSRFALLKLILNRNRKETDMEIKPQLTADTDDAAYNCGRLLAVLAETQAKAHDYKLKTGLAERYFGTASSSPASVLPLLLRLNRHHLDKIAKSGGNEWFLKKQIQDITAKFKPGGKDLPPSFPRNFNLQAQGRFMLGFYQQQAADAAARADAKAAREATQNTTGADTASQPGLPLS